MSLPLLIDLPGRDEAREAAQRELSRPAYQAAQPPWYQRATDWLFHQLTTLLDKATTSVPGGGWGLVVLVLLLAGVIAVIVVRLRPSARTTKLDPLFGLDSGQTAGEHRAQAEALAAAGSYAEAVRERFRAVVRELESRGVVDERPGRTADEVAREAGVAVPSIREPLTRGARLFDDIWYGGHTADAQGYASMVSLDDLVRTARLVTA